MGSQAPWALPGLESPYLISPKTCIFPFSHLRSWTCTLHWMLMKLLHVCVCRAGCCCWWHAWATEGSRCCTSGGHCVRVTRVHVCVSFLTWKGKRCSGWLVPRGKGTTAFPLTSWTCSKTRHAEFSQVKSIFLTRHLASPSLSEFLFLLRLWELVQRLTGRRSRSPAFLGRIVSSFLPFALPPLLFCFCFFKF